MNGFALDQTSRKYGRHFPDDIFKCIFLNENVRISINISLKFVPKGLINNIPALVQIIAWRRPGDKLLSEPMMESLLTHICVTRPQWVNFIVPSEGIWRHRSGSTLAQVMACCLTGPGHCNQGWLPISEVPWNWSDINFIASAIATITVYGFENYNFKITTTSPSGRRVSKSHHFYNA